TDGRIEPMEAVHAYHGILQSKGIRPNRSLEEDTQLTDQVMSYDGSAPKRKTVLASSAIPAKKTVRSKRAESTPRSDEVATDWPVKEDGKPDFSQMNASHRRAYDQYRLKRTFG
ncbi:hypothetical protein OAG77_01565, partial [bacterium]|nr:hypothetical protein [bacterium]